MSLIRMLTATRSLSDVKDEPSPYRMTEQGLLPKFGPRKNARGGGQKAREDARAPGDTGEGKENLGAGNGERKDADCSLKPESSRDKGLGGWWQRLFGRKRRHQVQGPVQSEFTLDLVKVVRNDLRDADASAPEPKKSKPKVECARVEESVFGASNG